MQPNRGIDGSQCDRHRNHRPNQFAGPEQSRPAGRLPQAYVPLHIFHDYNRIIHHQPDGEHNRQQGEQIQRESKNLHQKYRANQRNRDRHKRNQHRPQGSQKEEDHDRHNHQRFGQGLEHLANGLINILCRIIGDPPL